MLTAQNAIDHLRRRIDFNLRHEHHELTVNIAKQAQMYVSRDKAKQREAILAYRLRENDDQKEQRYRLTNPVTSVLLSPVISYFQQVERTDGVKLTIDSPDQQRKARIAEHFANYYRGDTLEKYCFDAALQANLTDPNSWVIFDYLPGTNAQGGATIRDLYPVEVYSDEVWDFAHDETGTLTHLAFEIRHKEMIWLGSTYKEVTLSDFFLYGVGFVVHFAEFEPGVEYATDFAGYDLMMVSNRQFYVRLFANNTQEVPAFQWGAYLSRDHKRAVYEPLFAEAIPILEDALRDKTFYDVTKAAHIFPEKLQYVKRCNHVDEVSGDACEGGWYGGEMYNPERRCKMCHGSGKLVPASEQDVVTLEWPRSAEDIVELAKLTHYVERPIQIPEFYREELRYYNTAVFSAVFNQQRVSMEAVQQAVTATQVQVDHDKVYNKLHAFAETICRAVEKAYRVAFQYYGADLQAVDMSYPADYKMKTVTELIAELKAAKDAGAPYYAVQSIVSDILQKQYRNAPQIVADIQAFEMWRPFKGKTPEEVAVALTVGTVDPLDRTLYTNWDRIMTEIQAERRDSAEGPFSLLAPLRQRDLLYAKAQALQDGIAATLPEPVPMPEPDADNQ